MLDKSQLSQRIDNLSTQELDKFDQLAAEWWDPQGKYAAAIAFNQARLSYFIPQISHFYQRQLAFAISPEDDFSQLYRLGNDLLQDLKILDLGCGGGLVAEPLAYLGAEVLGIDASATSIEVARQHASKHLNVTYRHALSDELLVERQQFDVVINAEVLEHVPHPQQLVTDCLRLLKPGGLLILATLNRSLLAYVIAILGAEYVLGLLPKGTHSWRHFIKPSELLAWTAGQADLVSQTGMRYDLWQQRWRFTQAMPVNYALCLAKHT